ncbi:type IV secretory system conjugative DNA transfer family protein [Leucobacter sp. UCMA 4100]|uniref:type IV secretory system conjugative DNA transfer family protein n=1 Tax=Leucobacter sp. UCMA 4100 TaxID=2810534 RepID=UPI0022EB0255|nr:TraM recognition domain-containing protein [Leucobacter sp. UCMA 4100]
MSPDQMMIISVVALVAALGGGTWASVYFGHKIEGTTDQVPSNVYAVVLGLFDGSVTWARASTWVAVGIGAVVVLLFIGWLWIGANGRKKRTRVDRAARYMGTGKDIEALTKKNAQATADRLGVQGSPGVPLGNHLSTGSPLYASWEDQIINIWGPRTGKTTSQAIPAILDAPGAVLVTSNKRDVVDGTRDVRAAHGPVFVFDPQNIALEDPTWWWNPLTYVTDEVKAARMAEHFASGSRAVGAQADAYFDSAGQDLLAGLLLAAALDKRPITDVYRWLTRPTDETAVDILREHDYPLNADQVFGVVSAPEKQRGGVYGTAQQMASCLTNRAVVRWITPQENETRTHFEPADFVRTKGTLYSLSKEGKGTAGPLVTALTVAVVEAAEELATYSPGGRLSVPLVGVLDEAANVCRWRALPDLYSHYGSRGIVLSTILQSWSQGVEVWGESGMKKLWSAANVKVYGGGVSERAFLEDLSFMVGEHDVLKGSVSTGAAHRSVSHHIQRERTLEVADLAAMPKGRALVLASGSRPTLIRTVPWMVGPHAEMVKASFKAHDPQASVTLAEAEAELVAVRENLTTEAA